MDEFLMAMIHKARLGRKFTVPTWGKTPDAKEVALYCAVLAHQPAINQTVEFTGGGSITFVTWEDVNQKLIDGSGLDLLFKILVTGLQDIIEMTGTIEPASHEAIYNRAMSAIHEFNDTMTDTAMGYSED